MTNADLRFSRVSEVYDAIKRYCYKYNEAIPKDFIIARSAERFKVRQDKIKEYLSELIRSDKIEEYGSGYILSTTDEKKDLQEVLW